MLDVKKILIIETAFIGDAILSLALAEEIKRLCPEVVIDYLVAPASASIMRHAPSVARVHSFDKRGEDAGKAGIENVSSMMNRENYDAVFSLHESQRTARVLSLLNARYKVGSASAKYILPHLTHSYFIPTEGRRTERIIELSSFLSERINRSTLPKLIFDDSDTPLDVRNKSNIVVLAPGSTWITKKWSESRFIEVGIELKKLGHSIVIIGGEADRNSAAQITASIGGDTLCYAGTLDIVGSGAIVSKAKLVIGNDSAPIHIATACCVKTVEIMGPTVQDFGFIPPPELGVVVEQNGLWCRPCYSHGGDNCPLYTHDCMKNVTSEMVLNAAMKQLAYAAS